MSGRQAKILSKDSCDDLLVFASTTRHPLRDRLIVLLSVKAGLRAAEIANLTWEMVLTPAAEIGSAIELHDRAAKKSGGRLIPIHPELGEALTRFARADRGGRSGHSFPTRRADDARSASSIGLPTPIGQSACKVAHRILAAAPSSPGPPGWSTMPVPRCETFNSWPVIGRSRPLSGTSTATLTPSASWCR